MTSVSPYNPSDKYVPSERRGSTPRASLTNPTLHRIPEDKLLRTHGSPNRGFVNSFKYFFVRSTGGSGTNSQSGLANFSNMRKRVNVQGPFQIMCFIHYTAAMVVLLSAKELDWSPNLRNYMTFVYFTTAVLIWELSRGIYARKSESAIPFYLTYIPFGVCMVISREAHMFVAILWYVSIVIIHMQSRCGNMQRHIFFFSAGYLVTYLLLVLFMDQFFTDTTGTADFSGDILDPSIQWSEESSFVVTVILMGVAYVMLERYTEEYAKTLIEKEMYTHDLYAVHEELKRRLREFTRGDHKGEIVVESPLQTVLGILNQQMKENEGNQELQESLRYALEILRTNRDNLFHLDIEEEEDVDKDVSKWINELLKTEAPDRNASLQKADTLSHREGLVNNMIERKVSSSSEGYENQITDKEVLEVCEDFEDWEYDIFRLAQKSNSRPLFYVTRAIFHKRGFVKKFNINPKKLDVFLEKVEAGYCNNPYHNSTHAADVTQTMNFFLNLSWFKNNLSDVEVFASILSCVVHDFEHPGNNNQFQIVTSSSFALRYNDRHVLEMHHVAAAYALLMTEECSFLENVSEEVYDKIREIVVKMVLATDMADHFDYVASLKTQNETGFDLAHAEQRILALEIAIKCADISNQSKPNNLAIQWTTNIMNEFFLQGDEERALMLPVSVFMDRNNTNVPKSQKGFIDFALNPLYLKWIEALKANCDETDNQKLERITYWMEKNEAYWITAGEN
eukprot:Nk52_evm29s2356 gene=Nk52_evmTU29s2356